MNNTNREILFKGKRNDNGEWIKGFYVIIGGENHCIFTGRIDLTQGSIGFEYFKVDSKTVGRFTGLTDKNGTNVFEGDILKNEYNRIFQVVWFKNRAEFVLEDCSSHARRGFIYVDELEVIGNIHDNHEIV